MAEEFQAGICGETWWNINSTRNVLFPLMMNSSSTCSVAANDVGYYNTTTWQNDVFGLKEPIRTCSVHEETINNNFDVSDCSLGFLDPISSNWNHSLFNCNDSQIQVSNVDAMMKPMDQEFSINKQSQNFPIESINSYDYPSTFFDPIPQTHNSIFSTNPSMSYSSSVANEVSSLMKPSMPKTQLSSGLQFSNNTPFWNASSEALHDIRAEVLASSQSQHQSPNFEDNKFNSSNTSLNKLKREKSLETKKSCESAIKRPRIETPSPLPTFKVRKEKLGDRITSLQQLVSPFGKTDTASVLHEAIEYIKFLHDQVNVLSTPYMKNESPIQHQQGCDNGKESKEKKQDLRSQGLCLVPISSTFSMVNETTIDFWTPTFGGPLFGR